MSKTIENLKSGNYEVVDNQGVSVTQHFIECLEKEFADLEAKLAESEKLTERLQQIVDKLRDKEFAGKTLVEAVNAVYEPLYKNKYDEAEELKQQLAEKEEEIERLKIYDEYRFELPYPKVKILGKTFEDIQELIDKWLKQGSKDKISFAVEQLEKAKGLIANHTQELWTCENDDIDLVLYEEIDKQINELKGKEERS